MIRIPTLLLVVVVAMMPHTSDACFSWPLWFKTLRYDSARKSFVTAGTQSVSQMIAQPPIPHMTQGVQFLDPPNNKILNPTEKVQVRLPSGAVVAISSLERWNKWQISFLKLWIRIVQHTAVTQDIIQAIPHGTDAVLGKTLLGLTDDKAETKAKRHKAVLNNWTKEELTELLHHYTPEIRMLLEAMPALLVQKTPMEEMTVPYPEKFSRAREALFQKWMKVENTPLPFPFYKPSPNTWHVITFILPGMGMLSSGISSTYGYHKLLKQTENSMEGPEVRIIPISIAYPFYGGPIHKRYSDINHWLRYLETTMHTVIRSWEHHGWITPHNTRIALLGRSTGATLGLTLHNRYPKKYPIVIAVSPMLSDPSLHLNPAKAIHWGVKQYSQNASDAGYISAQQLNENLVNLSASLIAQSFVEDQIPKRGNKYIQILWSRNDPGYPNSDVWLPAAMARIEGYIPPIMVLDLADHNVLSEHLVNHSEYSDVLQALLKQSLTPP